ncbi:OmpA family protein [Bradyrhizobium sp.]|uniref:OmpA family protein n=1 Tax=Bradyrhizobium sp. TaxID=376 RepID=UPI003C73840E
MQPGKRGWLEFGLLKVCLMVAMPAASALAQPVATAENMVNQLAGLEATADLDVAALRQQVLDRVKSKADAVALKRPPVAVQLLKLPRLNLDIQFNPDSPVIRPESYRTLGRVADTLTDPRLLPYGFLIVGHTDATGRRDNNLTLSQRRADSLRDVLVTTFKISPKRIQAVGLGEEQLQDAEHPKAAVNQQIQIVTVRKGP